MTATPNLGIIYLSSSQTSPEITVNEALAIIDVLAQGRVLDKDLTAPPASPVDGDAYIVGPSATGLWSGHDDDIAFWFDESGVWKFRTPKSGWTVEVVDEDTKYTFFAGSSGWGIAAGGGTITENSTDTLTNKTISAADNTITVATECIAGYIETADDKTYKIVVKMPHAFTITEATTISESGTCTATFKINTTALGGSANSVSSSETSQAHASTNTGAAGDDVQLTVSSNSSCLGLSFSIKYTRVLS